MARVAGIRAGTGAVSSAGLVAAALLLLVCSACAPVPSEPAASIPPGPRLEATSSSAATASAAPTGSVTATQTLLATAAVAAQERDPRMYPNPALTPGATLPVTAAQVSVSGYSSTVRNVPVSEKREAYEEYGLTYPQKKGAYECDHFIPLCLGGSNSIKNLWPEPHPEFHWKDGLEVYLWRKVRAGEITLPDAQRQIQTDWYYYWVRAGKPGAAASN